MTINNVFPVTVTMSIIGLKANCGVAAPECCCFHLSVDLSAALSLHLCFPQLAPRSLRVLDFAAVFSFGATHRQTLFLIRRFIVRFMNEPCDLVISITAAPLCILLLHVSPGSHFHYLASRGSCRRRRTVLVQLIDNCI